MKGEAGKYNQPTPDISAYISDDNRFAWDVLIGERLREQQERQNYGQRLPN